MSKKIISAILVMAMVISMSATALLSSVGAAAETETNYQADVDTLKAMLQEFVIEGPELATETIEYLQTLGILTWDGDNSRYKEIHARNEFWKNFTAANYTYFFQGEGADLAKNFVTEGAKKDIFAKTALTWETTTSATVSYADLAKANITKVIEYAASAWYFGQNADDANPDATFNAGRNEVVKKAIGMVNTILGLLKAEVKGDSKPAAYTDEFNGEFYRGFVTASKAYNQSIGFNPYLFILDADNTEAKDYYNDSYYTTVLGQYTVRWYTFAEAREIDAEGVFAFENAIRAMAVDNGAGVLFYDFINGTRADFLAIVDSLFTNLVGKVEESFFAEDIDEQIKSFLALDILVDLYDLYIKDVYNNIYTASSAKLLNDVLYAKRIIDYICDAEGKVEKSKLMTLILVDCSTLTNNILAGIEAVAPRSEQLLTATEITAGTALVRKADALLTNWASWASNDDYKGTWNALNTAKNNLKNMLPATEGADAVIVVEANSRKLKNFADKEVGNDRVIVEFAPNYFAYIKLYAELAAKIDAFTAKVTGVNGSLSAPNLTATSKGDLVDTINKYAHLVGIVGPIVEYADRTCDDVDNKKIELIHTYVETKCGKPDHNHYTVAGTTATKNAIATEKYMSYLFDKELANVAADGKIVSYSNYKNALIQIINNASLNNADGVNSMYEIVIGSVDGNNAFWTVGNDKTVSQDVAIDSVYVLMQTIIDACNYGTTDVAEQGGEGDDWSTENKFDSEGKFDWVNDSYVFTSGISKAVNAIIEAVKNLTKDLTVEIQTYAAILGLTANLFGWEVDIKGYIADTDDLQWNDEATTCWQEEENYPKDAFKNARLAATELAKQITDTIEDKDGNNVYNYTTAAQLIAAYNVFVDGIKTYLFTEAGADRFDEFVEDVYWYVKANLGTAADGWWNNYDKLIQKLLGADIHLEEYVADSKYCYEYFALTLKHAAECTIFGNRYNFANGTLAANLINPLKGHIGNMDVTGYTREWAEMYNAVRQIAAAVVGSVNLTTGEVTSDLPVWYAERILKECNEVKADGANYTTAKLVEYKAGLEALLIEADGLNVYNYVSNTDEAKAIWAAFVEAYANAQYTALDTRCAFADVDEAVAALEAAMAELAKIEAPEGAADADALAAKVAAAEALYARADATDADKEELEVAIAAAKKVLQFNISVLNSTDIEAEIKVLDDLMKALTNEMYTGKDLKKAVKVLELQVVVDLYTEASYRKFANAVEAAYAMAEEDTATESAMKAAYANVEARFGDLKLAPVEEEPEVVEPETSVVMEEAIAIYNDAANGYDKAVEGCTAESAAAYNAAINTLKADIENNADDAKLLESIIALNLAKAALTVDVPETCDC